MNTNWHLRARAVIYSNGKFLAVRNKDHSHSFLPGGHVEIGESATVALEREMLEECGRKIEIKGYLGAIESAWEKNDSREWEITHFFQAEIPDLETNPNVVPFEDGFDVIWITPEEFEEMNFLPMPLRELLIAWANGDKKIWWASKMG
jgi:ADP-ribose pyrophosphatase YjhB (NUDIX family)